MKQKALLTICLLAAATIGIWAQGPNNSKTYYKNADGKSGKELKTAMYNIIKSPTTSWSGLKDAYKKTDVRTDGYLRDWYSNATKYTPGSSFSSASTEGQGYNREHTIPQSWFGEASPMKADIVHVVPTDAAINGMRSDFPFGEVDPNKKEKYKQSKNGYSKFGYSKTPGYTDLVFEPNDEVKGDLARIYFYMATCYENQVKTWTKGSGGTVIQGDSYQPYVQWTFDMLMLWSQLDPVDEVEKARNIAAYDVQGNRNPFVDYPGLEDYIWGDKKEVPFSYDNYDSGGTAFNTRVAQPVFSPDGGTFTDSVRVTISCATNGAVIFYTTDGSDATVNSTVYKDSITLKTTTTLKAIAVCDSMANSYQQEATYIIRSGQSGGDTNETVIALNNSLFGTNYSGTVNNGGNFTGTKDGITVTYSKGNSDNQYISDAQIRLYAANTLTLSTAEGDITDVEFTKVGEKGSKVLQASTGSVTGMTWTGLAPHIVFNVNEGSGHIQLSQVKVKVASSNPPVPEKSDVNGDGVTDVADISMVISIMAGQLGNIPPGTDPTFVADVNGDGVVDVADIAAVISIMAGN